MGSRSSQPCQAGYTLIELLVTVGILGVVAAVGVYSSFNLARRERANTVASALAGWLDQVNRDVGRFNAQAGGATCTVTLSTGNLAEGAQMARVVPAACAIQPTLVVPDLEANAPSVQLTASPASFVFTPRGTVVATTDPVGITLAVNGQPPLRCLRLSGILGALEVGRNNAVSTGSCTEWGRI